jgi:Cu-processing system ATP-binding protein
LIEVKNIEKKFGKHHVLKNISINIQQGKITAIVGPNGSGKTTIIKSILGLVRPDRGDIMINGKTILGEHLYRKNIGYMPQTASFPENLTVKEVITMIADLRNQSLDINSNLNEILNLIPEMDKQIKNLSGGNKQKLSAYIALIFNPSIIILDEPTAGLDPAASSNFKQRILEERLIGKTIMLTSHIMNEIEELADNILFLIDGKIVFDGEVKDLIQSRGESKLEKAIANMITENTNGTYN